MATLYDQVVHDITETIRKHGVADAADKCHSYAKSLGLDARKLMKTAEEKLNVA